MEKMCRAVGDILMKSERALFVTGAGISADAGIPTYRGVGGLGCHRAADPCLDLERELDSDMLQHDPGRAWRMYRELEGECRTLGPDPAHDMFAEYSRQHGGTWTVTVNVDGLHRSAMTPNLIEVNGNLRDVKCTVCTWEAALPSYGCLSEVPACPMCDSVVRPKISLLGEPPMKPAVHALEEELARGFDVVACIGTSGISKTVDRLVQWTRERGTPLVEINVGDSAIARAANIRIPVSASVGITEVVTSIRSRPHPRAA